MTIAGYVALAFLLGVLAGGVLGIVLGALVADTLNLRRHRRRRATIDLHGADALESWLAGIDWPTRAPNGSPFEEGEVA